MNSCSSRSSFHQPWLNRYDMMAMAIVTVGMASSTPNSNILPSGTPSTPASASAPTPGTVNTMPHSRPMAIAAAMRPVPFLPIFFATERASGAEMTSSTSRNIDCSTVAMVNDIAYGIRFGPKTRSRVSTRRWMAPVCCRIAPISTPKAIRSPTLAMMSPNPVVMESIVFSTPIRVASPR